MSRMYQKKNGGITTRGGHMGERAAIGAIGGLCSYFFGELFLVGINSLYGLGLEKTGIIPTDMPLEFFRVAIPITLASGLINMCFGKRERILGEKLSGHAPMELAFLGEVKVMRDEGLEYLLRE